MVHPVAKGVKVGQVTVKLVFDIEDVDGFMEKSLAKGLAFGTLHKAKITPSLTPKILMAIRSPYQVGRSPRLLTKSSSTTAERTLVATTGKKRTLPQSSPPLTKMIASLCVSLSHSSCCCQHPVPSWRNPRRTSRLRKQLSK
jgi:hypothetical protein